MSMWRTDEPVLAPDGTILKGGMWAPQKAAYLSRAEITALVGGYGSGKTNMQAKKGIAMSLHNAPSPYMIVSPSYQLAKRTVIPAVTNLLSGRKIDYKLNKADMEIQIYAAGREATIWFGSGEHPDRLKGPNLCGAGIDEPFIQPREVFDQMLARVRDPIAKVRNILLTGTPEDLNWGYDICEGEEKGNYDLDLIIAPTRANKALPESFILTLERAYTDKMREAYLSGKFVNLSTGRIYYAFDRDVHVMDILPPRDAKWFVGMDFNVNPMAFCIFWHDGDRMHIVEEVEQPDSDTKKACDYVRKHYGDKVEGFFPDATGKRRTTSGTAGRSDHAIIRNSGYTVYANPSNPAVKDRHNAFNTLLTNGQLTISPQCRRMQRYLEQLTYENIRKNEDMTHLTDAAGYPVAYLHPVQSIVDRQRRWY